MFEVLAYSLITNLVIYSYGNVIKNKDSANKIYSIADRSIIGCILLSFIGLSANFFIPLNQIFNSLLLLIGVVFLIFKKKLSKKEIFYILISSSITFLLILYSNINRPDGGLYHLPYIKNLNEHNIIFGLTNIHFRFGHTSIIQYLSAINNNLIFKNIGIVIPLASIVSFFIIYFFNNVIKIYKKINTINLENIFSLFIIIFISYKINRYSSFGNDAVAHLCFFYLISKILGNKKTNLSLISLLAVFVFLNKTTMVITLLIPIIFFIKNFELKNFKLIYSLSGLLLIFWIIKNIIISGCAIYPIYQTCFNNLKWTDIKETKAQSTAGEAWAKDWPNRINKEITNKNYIKEFNWFESWKNKHGIKILKILIPYLIFIIFLNFFISKKQCTTGTNLKKKFDFKVLIMISLLGSLLFFLKFPLYRYGYSYLITFLILTIIFFTQGYNYCKLARSSKVILILCITIICTKQIQRYINNLNSKHLWPRIYSYDLNKLPKLDKIIKNDNFYIYKTNGELCMYSPSPCTNYKLKYNLSVKNKFNYIFINIK